MLFEERLRAVVAPYAVATQQVREREVRAADVVALHAPYLLRHFAEMAKVFDAPGLRSGQGAIMARRDGEGYTFVEYDAPALHITFHVVEGEPLLSWIAGGEADNRRITSETPSCVFDAALMDAASAFTNTRPAILAAKETQESEAHHA